MRRLRNMLCVCALLIIGACMPARAAAPGTTCYNAIPLGKDYKDTLSGNFPKTVWYTAWTFDLPLTVYFIPNNASDPAPEIQMDFGCTSGVYADPILDMLFGSGGGSMGLDMPHTPTLQTSQVEGHFCYYISMGKSYRDLLLKVGIDYNVQVFVKVTYNAPGVISMAPDDMFSNCMDGQRFMHFGDTVRVKTRDKDRHVIVPYVQWQEDSIRYIWHGTAPVVLAVGNVCAFDPSSNADDNILDYVTLQADDTLKMTSAEVKYYIQSGEVTSEAGMFYAKFYTEGTGVMKIEQVPQAPPQGGATLLRYDRSTTVTGNFDELFAISYTWTTATRFDTPTDHIFRMYVGTTADFTKETAIASYQFHANDAGHWIGLYDTQMQALWAQTQDKYLYIRFECSVKTNVLPTEWTMSECILKAQREIKRPSSTYVVVKGSYRTDYYRFYFREWKDGDMVFEWQSPFSTCPTFIGENCSFAANKNDTHVYESNVIAANGTWTLMAEDLNAMEPYVDEDGYLYIRFNPGAQGTMVVSTTAPEEQDPAPIQYPRTTINVICDINPIASGQRLFVFVSTSQSLSLYAGDSDNLASRTPIEMWSQTPEEDHTLVLQPGIYTLRGNEEEVRIVVQ